MIIKPNPSLGVPIYLQLVEQVKHAIETGALRAGDQLPSIRPLAEVPVADLLASPENDIRAFSDLRENSAEIFGSVRSAHDVGMYDERHDAS